MNLATHYSAYDTTQKSNPPTCGSLAEHSSKDTASYPNQQHKNRFLGSGWIPNPTEMAYGGVEEPVGGGNGDRRRCVPRRRQAWRRRNWRAGGGTNGRLTFGIGAGARSAGPEEQAGAGQGTPKPGTVGWPRTGPPGPWKG